MLAEQLQGVLNTRIVIEQAKGAVAQAPQVSVGRGVRNHPHLCARATKRLSEVALAVVTMSESVAVLLAP
jgi:hypothetical protein